MAQLVVIRHGQSQWNLENRFTGWSDVPLTDQGRADAEKVGKAIEGISFDMAFTSRLIRAKDTLLEILKTLSIKNMPIIEDSALNERHYGDLQGLNKAEIAEKYGKEKVQLWRRSFGTRPPNGESIEDCVHRTIPFFKQYIFPHIKEGKNILIAAHGNSIRPIRMLLENLDEEKTATVEIGLCTPYIYTFDGEKMLNVEERKVPGVVTLGASITEKTVQKGEV